MTGVQTCALPIYDKNSIPKDVIKKLKPNVDKIIFSIYGIGSNHNKICRTKAFNSLEKSVLSVIKEKIPFSFQTVAMVDCINNIEEMVGYIGEIKSSLNYCNPNLHVLRFIKQGNGEINKDQAISKNKIDNFMKLCNDLSEKYGVDISFGCSLREEDCVQDSEKAAITAYGEKITCSALKYGSKQKKFACKDRW